MPFPAAWYPAATWDGNEQDESNDVPGDDTIANAADHNEISSEIMALETDIRAGIAHFTGAADLEDVLSEVSGATPDTLDGRHISIHASAFMAESGAWTLQYAAPPGVVTLQRAASAGTERAFAALHGLGRDAVGGNDRGLRITSVDIEYDVTVGAVDDVRVHIHRHDFPATGVAPALSGTWGTADFEYDVDHDSAAKRGAVGWHHATHSTIDTPVEDFGWFLEIYVDGDAGAAGVVDVLAVRVNLTDEPR